MRVRVRVHAESLFCGRGHLNVGVPLSQRVSFQRAFLFPLSQRALHIGMHALFVTHVVCACVRTSVGYFHPSLFSKN